MPGPSLYGHDDFMREYECIVDQDLEFDRHAASWAPPQTGARLWDDEDESIDLPTDIPVAGPLPTSTVALTSDGKYLAVAVNTSVRLYDVETLELRAETWSYPSNVESISFRPDSPSSSPVVAADANYILISQNVELDDIESKIYKTVFDRSGRRIDDVSSFPLPLSDGALPRFGSRIWSYDGSRMLYVTDATSKQRPP